MHRSLLVPVVLTATLALLPSGRPALAANPSTTLAFDGAFSPLPLVPQPIPREGPALVFDPVRQRMIVFGGFGGTSTHAPLNDLWVLALGSHPTWASFAAVGTPPPARLCHTMVYDSARDRLIVYGGSTGASNNAMSDVWVLNLTGTPTWTQIQPSGVPPAARQAHCAIYDPLRDRMVVFGGYDGANFLNDTWALDFTVTPPRWLAVPAATPAALTPRDLAGAVYDPNQDRMVVCGGNAAPPSSTASPVDETWALNLSGAPAWTQLPVSGLGARLGAATAYDAAHQRLLVFGGWNGDYLSDALALDLAGSPSAWQPLVTGVATPLPRAFTAGAYDQGADRFVAFGGSNGLRYFSDACLLDLAGAGGWVVVDQPAARSGHSFSYDPNGRRGVLFGGVTAGAGFNDAWIFDLGTQTWTELVPAGTPPSLRSGHVAVVDEANDRLIVFGGMEYNSGQPADDVWSLSLGGTPAWTKLADSGARPPGLSGASGVYDGLHHRLLLIGGQGAGAIHNDVWSLALDGDPVWTAYPPSGAQPVARSAAGLAFDQRHGLFYWFGGISGTFVPLADTWQLSLGSLGTADWTPLPAAFPRGVWGQAVGVDTGRKRVIAIDGQSTFGPENHVYSLPFDLSTGWNELFPTGTPPSARALAAAFYDAVGNRIVLTGGTPAAAPVSDTWFLTFPDIPTPVLTTLVDQAVDGAYVHLVWSTPDGPGTRAVAERSADGSSWTALGPLVADASGQLVLDDVVPADGRWGYRLVVGPAATPTAVTWVSAGAVPELALAGATPNPAVDASTVAFSLRGGRPASLVVYDVRGRAVLRRDLSRLGPGSHTLALARGQLGGAGVYLLRLSEGERSLTRKLALLP